MPLPAEWDTDRRKAAGVTGPEALGIRRRVSPLELFFDLVFVFAVSQLSHYFLEHLSWRGAGETAVLLVAVFGVWAYTSFEATFLDIERKRTQYTLLIVMGLGLFMNAAITHAFTTSAWTFVVPLLLVVLIGGTVTATTAPTADLRRHYQRVLAWYGASAPLWVAGAVLGPGQRLWWWAAAAGIDLVGTWLAHPLPGRVLHTQNLPFDAEHMLERLRLFLILLLGETVLTIGRVMADSPNDLPTALSSVGAFAALVCLWAVYFSGGEDLVAAHAEATANPIRSMRLAMNVTYLTLAALVAVAVGSELAITHPLDHGSVTVGLLLFGGPAIYLAPQAWYFRATIGHAWVERLVACLALAVAGVGAVWLPPLVSVALLDVVLVALVVSVIRVHRRLAGTSMRTDEAPGR